MQYLRAAADIVLVFLAGRGTQSCPVCPPCICDCKGLGSLDQEQNLLGLVERQLSTCRGVSVAQSGAGGLIASLCTLIVGFALSSLAVLRLAHTLRPNPLQGQAAAVEDVQPSSNNRFSCPACGQEGFATLREAATHCSASAPSVATGAVDPSSAGETSVAPVSTSLQQRAQEQARRRRSGNSASPP